MFHSTVQYKIYSIKMEQSKIYLNIENLCTL